MFNSAVYIRPIQGGQKSKPQTFVHVVDTIRYDTIEEFNVAKYWPIFKLFHLHILWKNCNLVVTKHNTSPNELLNVFVANFFVIIPTKIDKTARCHVWSHSLHDERLSAVLVTFSINK